jgi:choline dehydrogenase
MIATRKPALGHPVTVGFIESAKALGKEVHLDINDIARLAQATGQQDINVDINMRRISAAHAYLLPALTRSNLTLLPNTTVTRLEISGGECRQILQNFYFALGLSIFVLACSLWVTEYRSYHIPARHASHI